jgi:hypothetical protein
LTIHLCVLTGVGPTFVFPTATFSSAGGLPSLRHRVPFVIMEFLKFVSWLYLVGGSPRRASLDREKILAYVRRDDAASRSKILTPSNRPSLHFSSRPPISARGREEKLFSFLKEKQSGRRQISVRAECRTAQYGV